MDLGADACVKPSTNTPAMSISQRLALTTRHSIAQTTIPQLHLSKPTVIVCIQNSNQRIIILRLDAPLQLQDGKKATKKKKETPKSTTSTPTPTQPPKHQRYASQSSLILQALQILLPSRGFTPHANVAPISLPPVDPVVLDMLNSLLCP